MRNSVTGNNLDQTTFERIFRDYFLSLCSFATKYTRDQDEAKDKKKFIQEDIPHTIESLSSYIDQSDLMEAEELRNEIYNALAELPEGSRNIFKMSRFEGKKYKEIAEELGISIKTVETQMSKALKHMKGKLINRMELRGLAAKK